MDTQKHCQSCQAPLAADAPRGLCPACLMKVAMATGTAAGQERPGFTPPSTQELARKFPQLEIIELIGRGGMGAVYKARQKELDRIVALKILPPGIGDDASFAERFAREAKALARLNHPGIITIHDFGRADGLYFFVMEFVDGVNLRQLLAASRVSPREALAIVPQICDALQFAHDQGIVHRDIKPENILLDRRGRVKVADFGLAKIIEGRAGRPLPAEPGSGTCDGAHGVTRPTTTLTDAGKVMGTPAYMAPEQVEHPAEVDHRADIYALGVVFYQMLTGELPGKRIEAPSKKVQMDVRLDEVVLRALEKQPELRYQKVSDVKTMLETITATPESAGVPPAGPGVAAGLLRPEAEQLGRDIARLLTRRGLLSFARRSFLWFAQQCVLLLDFAAAVPTFVEGEGRRRFNGWPLLLLFCSTIGFMVNSLTLAFSVAQRLWHGTPPYENPFALSAQEGNFLIWAILGGVGRLAALNLGQAPKVITARRVVVVCLWTIALASMVPCEVVLTHMLGAMSPADLTDKASFAKWMGIVVLLAVGLFLLVRVVPFYVRLNSRVLGMVREKTQASAHTNGLPALAAWLRLIDGGEYAQSWETAAPSFQRTISKQEWVGRLERIRRPLGKVLSRRPGPLQSKAGWAHFGASLVFATSFENLPTATETLTFARQRPNGEWKAIGYLIKPPGDAKAESEHGAPQAGVFKTGVEPITGTPEPGTGRVAEAQPRSGPQAPAVEQEGDTRVASAVAKSPHRPWPLIVVVVLFMLTGCFGAWDIGSNFHNHVYSANISVLGLSVGIGLLRLRPRWRVAALIMIWSPFILGACLGMAALFGQFTIHSYVKFFGFELTGIPRFLATIAACTLIPILLVWMSKVLTRSEVKALFQQASTDRPWLEWAALPAAIIIASVLSYLTAPSGPAQSSTANPLPESSKANAAPTISHPPAAEQPEATLGPAFGHEPEFRRLLADSLPVKEYGYTIKELKFSTDYQQALVVFAHAESKTRPQWEFTLSADAFGRYCGMNMQPFYTPGNANTPPVYITVDLDPWPRPPAVQPGANSGPAYGHEREFRQQLADSVPMKEYGYTIKNLRFSKDYQKALVVFAHTDSKAHPRWEFTLMSDNFRRYHGMNMQPFYTPGTANTPGIYIKVDLAGK